MHYSDNFGLPKLATYAKPAFSFTSTSTEEQRKERAETFCQVTFNDKSLVLGGKQDELYVPPQRREGVALIWEQYFPNFLIATKREGDAITLRGQLPGKGHEAIVKIGSKDATIDGKPFTLSGAPQEIDGPYELLHQCNGVLVRWDAAKNTLWVDARYLRRP